MHNSIKHTNRNVKNHFHLREGIPEIVSVGTFTFMIFLLSCEEPFIPELKPGYDDLLVIDGMISTDPGPYTFKLSRATTVIYPEYNPLSGCEVTIMDSEGHAEILTENSTGIYQTAADGIQGIAEKSYKIQIVDPKGNTYASPFEKMPKPVGIDTVFTNLEYHSSEIYTAEIPGYQFYVSTKRGDSDSLYFKWQMEHTWQYAADFLIYFYYDGVLHIFPDTDSLQNCWTTEPVYSIFTTSTVGLNKPIISNYPLHYIGFETRHFSIRYSLLIKQLTISEGAYEYWNAVKEQTTTAGNLYTHLPYQIKGNVSKIDDEKEPVLGYFQVVGINTKRLFFDRPESTIPMYYPICELTQPDYEAYGWMFYNIDPRDWPEYVTMDGSGQRALPNRKCVDCRESGGLINKPEFWIDE